MVKSKKKKAKEEDFKKPKLKVGKKKANAANFTDTTFKSKAISLAVQSVTVDKSAQLTNSRNLTLSELLGQVNHGNTGVRKDALIGIREMLENYRELRLVYLPKLVNITALLIKDEDSTVRKMNLELCRDLLIADKPKQIYPFLDLLMLHTCSGMTHLYEDIREDSIKFLNLWLEVEPKLATKYLDKVLPNYFSLLKIGNLSKASHEKDNFTTAKGQIWSQKSRVSILENFHIYLTRLTTEELPNEWFLGTFVSQKSLHQTLSEYTNSMTLDFTKPIEISYDIPSSLYVGYDYILGNTALSFANSDTGLKSAGVKLNEAIPELYKFLIATWIETCSNVLIDTNKISLTPELKALHLTLKLILWVWRYEVNDASYEKLSEYFASLQKFVLPYFPFAEDMHVSNDFKVTSTLLEMNLIVTELAGLYLLVGLDNSESKTINMNISVVNYLLSILGHNQSTIKSITNEHLKAMLPSIWWYLNGVDEQTSQSLTQALLKFSIEVTQSGPKSTALDFLLKIIKIQKHPHFNGNFKLINFNEEFNQNLGEWLIELLKQLKKPNLNKIDQIDINKIIIDIFHQLIRYPPALELLKPTMLSIHQQIADLLNEYEDTFPLSHLSPSSFILFFNTLYHLSTLAKPLYITLSNLKAKVDSSSKIYPGLDLRSTLAVNQFFGLLP